MALEEKFHAVESNKKARCHSGIVFVKKMERYERQDPAGAVNNL